MTCIWLSTVQRIALYFELESEDCQILHVYIYMYYIAMPKENILTLYLFVVLSVATCLRRKVQYSWA